MTTPNERIMADVRGDTLRWLESTHPMTTTPEDVMEYAVERTLFYAQLWPLTTRSIFPGKANP